MFIYVCIYALWLIMVAFVFQFSKAFADVDEGWYIHLLAKLIHGAPVVNVLDKTDTLAVILKIIYMIIKYV